MALGLGVAMPALAYSDSGLDVPYVQTPDNVVDSMLELANVTANDYVIDLGAGDGRLLIGAAQQRGASGFGVDIDPRLVELANKHAKQAGVADRAHFVVQDLFDTDLSKATVVMLYLLPDVNLKLRPVLLDTVQPGTRVVSHDYGFGDWQPDRKITVDAPNKPVNRVKQSDLLFWVVPAKVQGSWTAAQDGHDYSFNLQQRFQFVQGTVQIDDQQLPISEGRLKGRTLTFSFKDDEGIAHFEGSVNGAELIGNLKRPGQAPATEVRLRQS